jgi:hypothetical protein
MELCRQASVEQDGEKLFRLVCRINATWTRPGHQSFPETVFWQDAARPSFHEHEMINALWATWFGGSYDYTIESPSVHTTGRGMMFCRKSENHWYIRGLSWIRSVIHACCSPLGEFRMKSGLKQEASLSASALLKASEQECTAGLVCLPIAV